MQRDLCIVNISEIAMNFFDLYAIRNVMYVLVHMLAVTTIHTGEVPRVTHYYL